MRFPDSGSRAPRRRRGRRAARVRRAPHPPVAGPPLPLLHRTGGGGSCGGRPLPAAAGFLQPAATFAAPRVVAVVNAQSVPVLSVSVPFGRRLSDPSTVLESASVSIRMPSTRLYVVPSIVAAVTAPS